MSAWVLTIAIAAGFVAAGLFCIGFARVAVRRWADFREWERLRDQSIADAQREARVRARAQLRHPTRRRRDH